MWIRLETGWHRDRHIVTLAGTARLVILIIWCLAAEEGEPTFDDDGEPEHSLLPLEWLEPTSLAKECALSEAETRAAIETLRLPIPATDWSPASAPRLSIDVAHGVAIVRNVGKYQAVAIKDRMRARAKMEATRKLHGGSMDVPRKSRGGSMDSPRMCRTSSVVRPAKGNCAGEGVVTPGILDVGDGEASATGPEGDTAPVEVQRRRVR